MRVYLDESASLSPLLYKILETSPDFAYPAKILAAMPKPLETPEEQRNEVDLIEPLSRRELEVLRLVTKGATNREICQTLHIALGTVKNHLKNIYGKMNVHNRTQAAARTRTLGLFN
jgi:LuxR family maltose regulon positive regulatory protein